MSSIGYAVSDSLVLARRNLSHVRQVPERLIDVTIQPLMFVLLFAFVFGGAIPLPGGGDYHEFLMAGIFVQTLAFGIVGPATGMATDLSEGMLDRLLSLPMARAVVRARADPGRDGDDRDRDRGDDVAGLIVGWTPAHRRALGRRRLRAAAAVRLRDPVGRDVRRPRRAVGRRRDRHRVPGHLPADVRGQRVRARPRRCPACCARSPTGTRSARRSPRCATCSATRRPPSAADRLADAARGGRPSVLWSLGDPGRDGARRRSRPTAGARGPRRAGHQVACS